MELYFFRHAIAQDRGGSLPDHLRPLTDEGIANTRRAAPVLRRLGIKPDRLYSSPLIRARQTADILAAELHVAVQVRQELSPGFNLSIIERLTRDLGEDAEVLFVGHEPDFSATLEELTGGRILVKKGGLVRVDVTGYHPLSGELVYALTPKVFNRLG